MSIRTSLKNVTTGLALAGAIALAACGTNPGDRAVSGGILGAGAGAVIAGATGGSVGTGAAIGAVGGAVLGAATDPCDLNLGDPYWRHRSRHEYYERCGHH